MPAVGAFSSFFFFPPLPRPEPKPRQKKHKQLFTHRLMLPAVFQWPCSRQEEAEWRIPLGLVEEKWLASFDQLSGVLISVISLFCWLWACWGEQESWLLRGPRREANSIAAESQKATRHRRGLTWKQTPWFCQRVARREKGLWEGNRVGAPITNSSVAVLNLTISHHVQNQSSSSWNYHLEEF